MLDMRTVFISYVVTSALCLVVVGSLWLQNRERHPETGLWFADYIAQFAAILLIALRGIVPDFASMSVSNALVFAGTVALYQGLERYLDKRSRQLHNYVALGVLIAAHSYFAYVQPSLAARNIVGSVALLFITAQCAWLMLRRVGPELRFAARPAGGVFAAFAVASIAHILVNLRPAPSQDLFMSGILDSGTILLYQTLYIALTFSLLMLISRRLLAALERDIWRREATEKALRASEERFSIAFHNIPDAVVISRRSDGTILEANEGLSKHIGYPLEEMIGKTTTELGIWQDEAARSRFIDLLAQDGRVSGFETVFHRRTGETFPAVAWCEVIEVGGESALLMVVHDATERKLAEEHLIELSSRDPLTGVLNQRAFYETAAHRLATLADSQIALIFLDLDNLKAVNDLYGHPVGDQTLVLFADVLRKAFRESDVIGRLGGDEFAVLAVSREVVPDFALLERYVAELLQSNTASGLPFTISSSFGVAWWDPQDGAADLDALINSADIRMYEAKRAK
jgi:diguanylate cyclase (GGDEF)-like protein/PAS domain S-box-containing protein